MSETSLRPVILVTGAARRLGRGIALDLARHGYDIALHYRGSAAEAEATQRELRDLGARCERLQADLGDEAQTLALVPAAVTTFGRLDGLVNSASLMEHDDVEAFGYASMERHWRSNTAAPIVLARALHAHLVARGGRGCVVNLLDQKLWNPNPDALAYTLSKAALETATGLLARAFAPHLRLCGVAPGLTLGSPLIDEAMLQAQQRASPLGHGPTVDDIASAVRFMLEAPAATGTTVLIDAGQHLQPRERDFPFKPSRPSARPAE